MFVPHPSRKLNEMLGRKPYQGANPAGACFLFVGLDANYAPDLEDRPIFSRVLEYHGDGVTFWQRAGVHHPFLLPQYSGDGRRYHQAFARIGFQPSHAQLVSFIELLHVPTVGVNSLEPSDLLPSHLNYINDVIFHGTAQHVFLSSTVLRHMQRSKRFPWARAPKASAGALPIVHQTAQRTIYMHLHFSYQWGKRAQLQSEASAIAALRPPSGV